ncbi:hypothetical protein LV779_12600 [Streptomyces thinghirensis]|nr:hypothetical protein [Streptomyces thinghirensis]
MILSAFFVTYALTQIPGGLIAGRFGGVRVMCLAPRPVVVVHRAHGDRLVLRRSAGLPLPLRCGPGPVPGGRPQALSRRSVPRAAAHGQWLGTEFQRGRWSAGRRAGRAAAGALGTGA